MSMTKPRASQINFTPSGTLSSTNVQSAITELVTDLAASSGSSMAGYLPSGTGAVSRTVQSKLRESVSVLDFGAVGDGVTDDTAAIQTAISTAGPGGVIRFPYGSYAVTSISFDQLQQCVYCEGQIINFESVISNPALVKIVAPNCLFYGLQLQVRQATNYTAVLQLTGNGSTWAEFTNIIGLEILFSPCIGVLLGDVTTPVIGSLSENYISNYTTIGVQIPLYCNQPQGFLMVNNSTLNCDPNGYGFDMTIACCINNANTNLFLSNCELIKASSVAGTGIKNFSQLTMTACYFEVPCIPYFLGDGSYTQVMQTNTSFWNNATQWFVSGSTGANYTFLMDQCVVAKSFTSGGAGNGIVFTQGDNCEVIIQNSTFINFTPNALFSSDSRYSWGRGNVKFINCLIDDTANASKKYISMSDPHLAGYYNRLDISKFTVDQTGTGTSASIVSITPPNPNFVKSLQIIGSISGTITVSTKIGIDTAIFSQNRHSILEVTMGVDSVSLNFSANIVAYYYDNGDSLIGYQVLGEADGGVANLFTGIAGAQEFKTMRKVLVIPANSCQIKLSFTANSVNQVWNIGNIKVY